MDQRKIGAFLRALRKGKNLTQEQLAEEFNVSSRTVSRWETGSNLPDISLLVEIADFYDVDVREIIDGERKSEMMDQETREVADKMAAYAGNEKNRLLRFVQIAGFVGIGALLIALVLQALTYEPDLRRSGGLFMTFVALVVMNVITLYVTGLLEKITARKKLMKAVRIVTVAVSAAVAHYVLMFVAVFGLAAAGIFLARVDVNRDVTEYNKYIHIGENYTGEYAMGNYDIFDVFPETISDDADAAEYQLTYYNPWDSQYIVYMTLDYREGYEEEIERLRGIGIGDYRGIYSVTGAPEGYDLIAMHPDPYYGFTYAMIPHGSAENSKITYVAIVFCNYCLDVNVRKYLPEEYLLPGFDAGEHNPYKKQMMKEP